MVSVQKVLANPVVRINNVIITIKPGSASFDLGKGEEKVSGVSVGGGASSVAISDDVTTRVGKMKVTVFTTGENIQRFRDWKSVPIGAGNTVSFTEDNTHIVGKNMRLVNSPDMKIGVDESFDLEFNGSPLESG